MPTVTDLNCQSNEETLSPRSRMLVLVVAFAALVFDGVELGLMPVASLSVSQSLHPLLNTGKWSQPILNEVDSDGNRLPYDKGTAPCSYHSSRP